MHPSTTAIITATEYTNGIFLQIHMFRFFTVDPVLSGHHQGMAKSPLNTG